MTAIDLAAYSPEGMRPREVEKTEHDLGRALLRHALAREFGLSMSAEELADRILPAENGKPYLREYPGIHFNISHTGGLVACGVADSPLGIDAEHAEGFPEILIKRVLAESERAYLAAQDSSPDGPAAASRRVYTFFRFWTLKEAYVKRSGVGMDADVRRVRFDLAAADSAAFFAGRGVRIPCTDPAVTAWQYLLPGDYILSVCSKISSPEPELHLLSDLSL